ncbi:hypothetical protein [Hydrogenophaga sp. 5NK40-0174]|uniref:hypothetical protein n=1 Tax=Hydrogenophaga sp. 5NK40-0174 TaxID=3127649 RepID=UPI00310771A6
MKTFRISLALFLLWLLAGCSEIDPVEIKEGTVGFYRKSDGTVIAKTKSAALSKQQIQFVQGWLNDNRKDWSSHIPMATYLPLWCMSISTINEKPFDLCRIGDRLVLRGPGKEIEHPLSESDSLAFSQNIDAAGG